jgi:hypothetical protein
MASETKIVVKDVAMDAISGRVTYTVIAVTTEGNSTWSGPARQYSFDREILRDRFGGMLDRFEQWIAVEQQSLMGIDPQLLSKIMNRKGATLATYTGLGTVPVPVTEPPK